MSRAVLVTAFVVALPFPCSKKEEAPPPPVEVKTGPTPDSIAKWTKARTDYDARAKANGARPDVVAAVDALFDHAKASGEDVFGGASIVKNVDTKGRTTADSDLEDALKPTKISIESRVGQDGCDTDYKYEQETKTFPVSFAEVVIDETHDGIWVTATITENPEQLHLVDQDGKKRDFRQLQATVNTTIHAPGKPVVRVSKKVDVHGVEVEGNVRVGYELGKASVYNAESKLLKARICRAIPELLGLSQPSK